jgi:enamine deaminase RidA (YjgF/YER057c/UK114 family)
MIMSVEQKLTELGYKLPDPPKPLGFYVPAKRVGNLVYTSGQGSRSVVGKVGGNLTLEEGQAEARESILNCLAAIKSVVGDLDKVEEVWKVLGFVNSAPGFDQQPKVINGASELLINVFGENGRHARSAIGTSELPNGIAVEIEIIVKVRD